MPAFSRNLKQTLDRALASARERRHEYATLEHLLLSLIEDSDASAVLRACSVDLDVLGRNLRDYLDRELDNANRRRVFSVLSSARSSAFNHPAAKM
jgi:ATP-dependent Clp protease ATP-binding subunit ClpA